MKIEGAVLRRMGLPRPYAASGPLAIETLELEPPGRGEACVRILAAGLCHSDLSVIDGSRPRGLPMVLGHEAAGEVVGLGPDTDGFAIGDRVVFSFVPQCGCCAQCHAGRAALCSAGAAANAQGRLLGGARRLHHGTEPLNHHLGVSAFATHAVASTRSLVRIDHDLDPAIAALFGCAVLTGVGAVVNTARVAPGDAVAVFGLGGVGMSTLLGAIASGANPLIAVDRVPHKLALARRLGATAAIEAGDDPEATIAAVRDASAGGVDVAFETVGSAAVVAQAYAATRRGGTTVALGLPDPAQQVAIPAVGLVVDEKVLRGSYMGSAVPSRDIQRFIALHRAGRLPVEQLLTARLRLAEINQGFDRLAQGDALRQVVVFS